MPVASQKRFNFTLLEYVINKLKLKKTELIMGTVVAVSRLIQVWYRLGEYSMNIRTW